MNQQKTGLLADLLVLELGSVLACPAVGFFLAELGARVIKIENATTHGDVTRTWKLSSEDPHSDLSAYFSCVNWGKESLGLDLTRPEGSEILQKLAALCDIILVNYKSGDADKLGTDYETLKKLNPRLIYGHITGYGLESPRSGYDAVIQGESGFTFMNGEPGSPPTKLPVAFMDLLAAHQLKEGLLLALLKRERTGKGDYVSVSLLQAGIASLANQAANWQVGGSIPTRMGSDHPNIAPYGTIFTTADGKEIVLAIGSDKQFAGLCAILGRQNLSRDPRFADNQSRVKNRDLLKKRLKELIRLKNRDSLLDELEKKNIPAGSVNNMREVLNTPQAQAIVMEGQTADGQTMHGLRNAIFSFQDTEILCKDISVPPHFGEHSHKILTTLLSMIPDEIDRLCRQGIVHAR